MDGVHPHFTVRMFFSFLLLILLQMSAEAQNICSVPAPVEFAENNMVDDLVVTITVQPDATVAFKPPPANPNNPFKLNGNRLLAARVLDFEAETSHVAQMICTAASGLTMSLNIIVIVTNVNDNSPVFEQSLYQVNVNELSPVNTTVGRFSATDLDGQRLYYTLTSESNGFKLMSPTNPEILVQTPLEYDTVKNVRLVLFAQDTPLAPANSKAPLTASTTIMVTIVDVDNRPPWFQPCTKHEIGGALICQSSGYTGRVILNEQQAGALPLKPGPLYATDGDSGINEEITYGILSGNDDGLFEINQNTGNISMVKPADVLDTISLTVLAAQKMNSYQFATTTVTFSVQAKSLHPPQFQMLQYDGTVTGVGKMAMDQKNKDEPLLILATDADYAATGGLNPHITYNIKGSSDFTIVDGYLFMTKDLPEATLRLQVVAVDMSNEESATAQLLVEVKSGLTTTSVPLSTTGSMATTSIGESTTSSKTTEDIVSPTTSTDSSISTTIPTLTTTNSKTTEHIVTTTKPIISTDNSASTTIPTITTTNSKTTEHIVATTNPSTSIDSSVLTTIPSMTSETIGSTTESSMPTEGSDATTNPSLTSEGSVSTTSTAHTVIIPSGGYGPQDMAALGATLGVLLFICLVVMGLLTFHIRMEKGDWKKIYETNMFRSSLCQGLGSQKEGIQYTNDAFQNDEDGDSTGSGSPERGSVMSGEEPRKAAGDIAQYETIITPSVPLHSDDTSQAGSDKADNEKEVRPILTKERRMEEGYKSVWFKEDIDPDAKEEVVIIPDSRESDSEEEDEEQTFSGRDEDEDDNLLIKTPRVGFNDVDLNSGLRVKIEDPAEDSEDDEVLTDDL